MYLSNYVGIASLLSAFIAMLLAIYSSRKSKVPRAFNIFLFFIVTWSLANAFSYFSDDLELKLLWHKLELSSLSFFIYFWLSFICAYADSLSSRQQKALNWFILLPSVISLGVWTNSLHGLFWSSAAWNQGDLSPLQLAHGPVYWFLFIPYFYTAVFSSLFMLASLFFNSGREHKRQTALLIIATLLPVLSSVLYFNSNDKGFEVVDYTPFAILGSSLIVALLIFKDKQFKYLPIMAKSYFKSASNAVFMLNSNAVIMDYNLGAKKLVEAMQLEAEGLKSKNLFDLFPELLSTIDSFVIEEVNIYDFSMRNKYLDISIVPVQTQAGKIVGYALSLRDVSRQHKNIQRITELSEFRKSILDLQSKIIDDNSGGNLFQEILIEAVNIISDAEAGSVILLGSDGLYRYRAVVGYDFELLSTISFKFDELLIANHRYSKEVMVIRDYESHISKIFTDDPRADILRKCSADIKSTISIPIYLEEKLVAVIYLDSKTNAFAFDQEVEEMAEIFANHIADTIQRSRLRSEIKGLSSISNAMISLNTKLLNQDSFESYYELLLVRAEDVLELAVEAIPNAELGSFLLRESDGRFHFKAARGFNMNQLKDLYFEYEELFFASAEPDKATYSCNDIAKNTARLKTAERIKQLNSADYVREIKSSLAIPVYIDNDLFAVFNIDNTKSHRAFSDGAIKIAEAFGNHINNLMYKVKLQKEISILDSFKESMMELSTKLLESQSLREFYHLLLTKIIEIVPEASYATILEKKTKSEFRIVASYGYSIDKFEKNLIKSSSFPKELCQKTVNSIISNDFKLAINNESISKTSLLVPIRLEDELKAVMVLSTKDKGILFDAQARQFAEVFASQVAAMLRRRQAEYALKNGEMYDQLTGLVNKQPFLNRISHYLKSSYRKDSAGFAVLFLEIDKFKRISSSYGHGTADQLLKYVAKRLEHSLKPADTIARWSSSSFVILLEQLEDKEEVIEITRKLRQTLAKSFLINDAEILITVSLGIVYDNGKYSYPEEILQNAEITLNKAKSLGLGYLVFNKEMSKQVLERLRLENDIRAAIVNEDFHLVYQPIVDLQNSGLVGVEALLRWNHPKYGEVSPSDFIPLVEELGLITSLDKWVMKTAIRQLKLWIDNPYLFSDISISINLSASSFLDLAYLDEINATLANDHELRKRVRLEITEHALMEDIDNVRDILTQFRAQGVKILIDDFGTGYSSLSYLHELPLDILKIDRSFIKNLPNAQSEFMVKTIVSLAHNLELEVIAEGVETLEQADYLKSANCEYAQGYYYNKAMSPSELEKRYLSKQLAPV